MSISVIIPCYLKKDIHEFLLMESLESLTKQTYKSFEVNLVINNCKDNEQSLDYKIKNKFSNLLDLNIYYFKERKNSAFSRNYAISKSKYNILSLLDSDDLYTKNKLETQINFINKNPQYDFISSRFLVLKNNLYYEDNKFYGNTCPMWNDDSDIKPVIKDKNIICGATMMFKKSCFEKINGYDEEIIPYSFYLKYKKPMCEDWDLWIRAIENNMKFYMIQQHLYVYRQGYSCNL